MATDILSGGFGSLPLAGTVYPSASYIAAPTPGPGNGEFGALMATGLIVVIDITAFVGTSVTFNIEGFDPASGKWYLLLASAALAAVATTVLRVDPRIPVSANVVAQASLPSRLRVRPVNSAITTLNYSVGATLTV